MNKSVFAPDNGTIVSPECTQPDFVRHIAEVWDDELRRYVIEFYIHVTPDSDCCINFDRKQIEIKTYDKFLKNLKEVTGETVTYKLKFRIPPDLKHYKVLPIFFR